MLRSKSRSFSSTISSPRRSKYPKVAQTRTRLGFFFATSGRFAEWTTPKQRPPPLRITAFWTHREVGGGQNIAEASRLLSRPGCSRRFWEVALSHLRVGKDILSPSGSSLAIVSHMCGSAGLFSASGPCNRTRNAGGRARFLRVAFFVSTAFGQATPNQVRLGPAGCVDPRPKQMETGGRAKCADESCNSGGCGQHE